MIYQEGEVYTIRPHRGKPFPARFIEVDKLTQSLPMLVFERTQGNRKGSRIYLATPQMKRTIRERTTK